MKSQLFSIRVILLSLIVTLVGCGGGGGGGSSSPCSTLGAISKVVGGDECKGGLSPVVALLVQDADNSLQICSGTLISLTTVLTAGHCLHRAIGVNVYTQQGLLAEGGQRSVHPNWLSFPQPGNPYDLAMLRISTPQNIGPVPLLLSRSIVVGQSITVFGYGLDESRATAIDRVQSGGAPLKAGNMTIGAISQGLFGAAFDLTGDAICQGDSGGPVTQTVNGVTSLVGITSFTQGGCAEGSLSGFVNIQRQDVVDYIAAFAPDISVQ